MRVKITFKLVLLAALAMSGAVHAAQKPNILIIWGDDIGPWNLSTYNQGMMGFRTPNIDRIARVIATNFTDTIRFR